MTMKFMQRAAASSPTSTTETADGNPSKRRKISKDESPMTTPGTDVLAVQTAVDAEDAKRAAVMEKIAAEAGETKWVLSTSDPEKSNGTARKLRFLSAGYSDIDQDDEIIGRPSSLGRRSFGRLNNNAKKQQDISPNNPLSTSADEDDSGTRYSEDDDTHDITDPTEILIREEAFRSAKAERKAKKMVEEATATRVAEKRRGKEIKLSRLSSISGGGGAMIECHFCGQKGHKKADCPRKAKIKRRREEK
ncbi:MAG: hypothetical protein Q9219_004598 [cf. Caloplaca sp. 3 TL-2023]